MSFTENSINILELPNEILIKIIKLAKNNKNFLLTCKKFHELISEVKKKNLSLFVNYKFLVNPFFDLDKFIESSSVVNFNSYIADEYRNFSLSNQEEKLWYFLKIYGHKIKHFIVNSIIENFVTKILPLMPNLEELTFLRPINFEQLNIEKISIKIRKINIYFGIDLKQLEIFDFDELELDFEHFSSVHSEVLDFLKYHKNIKNLTLSNVGIDLTKALKLMKLEKLEIYFLESQMKNIGNILRNQKQIKELKFLQISREILTIICDNLKNLEKIFFNFNDRTLKNSFKKLSDLKFLKSLKIDNFMNLEDFEEFSKVEFEGLEILEIKLFYNYEQTLKQIENLSENVKNLKVLSLGFYPVLELQTIIKILEKFNNLESLSLIASGFSMITENERKEFFKSSHKNENLKILKFCINFDHLENLITKFSLDFPNLETIFIQNLNITENNLKMVFEKFPNLQNYDKIGITENLLETFLENKRNLKEFYVDLNILENPNEIFKDHSLSFEVHQTLAKVVREEEKKITISLMTYSHWKRIRHLIELDMQPKNLTINLINDQPHCDEILFKIFHKIGTNVKNLTLFGEYSNMNLAIILENLPNCGQINFDDFVFIICPFITSNMKNIKIHSILFKYDFANTSIEFLNEKISKFFDGVKFLDNSLKSLKIIFRNFKTNVNGQNLLNFTRNHLKNQEKLTKVVETFDRNKFKYTIEFEIENI
ncbi:hypothetical protein PVAND_017270 [Polypedilum vanderplanki]|uniref:F-box domain-containing protein n=1 Tax=Polypedilum vanderplanki TaxID=319348 RepID=A0A9J6BIJ7_POLVA|nr:hypothetical protein PVAND_017270 [Polypedilum vanderplanki]